MAQTHSVLKKTHDENYLFSKLKKELDHAETTKNWTNPLQTLKKLAEINGLVKQPIWVAIEMLWMQVQFAELPIALSKSRRIKRHIAALKALFCGQFALAIDDLSVLVNVDFLRKQGIHAVTNIAQFLAHPKSKEVSPHILFNVRHYKGLHNLSEQQHPVVHFFRYASDRQALASDPNRYFDCNWYRETYLQAEPWQNPLLHYLRNFQDNHIRPNQHFYNGYVRQTQNLPPATDPLTYYISCFQALGGDFCFNGFSPCPYFDRAYYLSRYPDIRTATENSLADPYWHFFVSGLKEGRKGHPWLSEATETLWKLACQKYPLNNAADFQGADKSAVLVLGMHRSGTSALTRAINLLGLDLPSHLMPATSANETGYWESVDVSKIHDDILVSLGSAWDDFLPLAIDNIHPEASECYKQVLSDYIVREFSQAKSFVVKDPRMCRLAFLWIEVLAALKVQVNVIIPFRHPLEVAQSMGKRDGFVPEKVLLMWLRYVLEAECQSRDLPRCFVNYAQLLNNPRQATEAIVSQCAISVTDKADSLKQIEQFVDVRYYHQQLTLEALQDAEVSEWVIRVYAILNQWSNPNGNEQAFRAEFDQIAYQLAQADKLYAPIMIGKK